MFINYLSTGFKWGSILISSHIVLTLSPIWCNILMSPMNYLTNVYCLDEGGGISIRGSGRTVPKTKFERIVQGQGVWLWGLMGIMIPFYFYPFYFQIILSTILAYPLGIYQYLKQGR